MAAGKDKRKYRKKKLSIEKQLNKGKEKSTKRIRIES